MVRRLVAASPVVALALLAGCSDYREDNRNPPMRQQGQNMPAQGAGPGLGSPTANAINAISAEAPSIGNMFQSAYAYAIFPEVAKGGLVVGAAHGEGWVYERGNLVGTAEVTQVTVGAQVGGQTYREVIFFQDVNALNRFKQGNPEFSANASAVIVKNGAAAANDYRNGVAIYVLPIGGAMLEASIGGQDFKFRPMNQGW